MPELPASELRGAQLTRTAGAGGAIRRQNRGDRRRGADEEIHDAARDVAEPAHQCHRLGTGPWRHQAFRGVHDAADSNKAIGSTLPAQTAPRSAKLPDGAVHVEDIAVTIIDGIAERIGAIRYKGLPGEAVRWAKAAILDTVGVPLAGAGAPG